MLTIAFYQLSYFNSGLTESVVSFLHDIIIYSFFVSQKTKEIYLRSLKGQIETCYNSKANKEMYLC